MKGNQVLHYDEQEGLIGSIYQVSYVPQVQGRQGQDKTRQDKDRPARRRRTSKEWTPGHHDRLEDYGAIQPNPYQDGWMDVPAIPPKCTGQDRTGQDRAAHPPGPAMNSRDSHSRSQMDSLQRRLTGPQGPARKAKTRCQRMSNQAFARSIRAVFFHGKRVSGSPSPQSARR